MGNKAGVIKIIEMGTGEVCFPRDNLEKREKLNEVLGEIARERVSHQEPRDWQKVC